MTTTALKHIRSNKCFWGLVIQFLSPATPLLLARCRDPTDADRQASQNINKPDIYKVQVTTDGYKYRHTTAII
eukprot:scaffold661712_cov38-Prasinocladus_malaysianus.AAC.1